MASLDLVHRSELAARLRLRKPSLLHALTPEFQEHHLDFLTAALEAGSPTLFGDYLRWTGRVLGARGLQTDVLIENVAEVTNALLAKEEGDAASLIQLIHDGALARFAEPAAPVIPETNAGLAAMRATFVESALHGDRKAALQLALDAQERERDTTSLYVGLFQKSMHDVGRLWETNRITVAQEHMATATVQYVVAQLYSRLPTQPTVRGKALITGVEGEHHQLGPNLVADVLEARGFDVRFLGTDVPQAAVLSAVEEERPTLIGISTTMAFNLPKAIALVRALQSGQAVAPRILLGGAAFAATPDLVIELGVFGIGRDVGEALALAESAGTT